MTNYEKTLSALIVGILVVFIILGVIAYIGYKQFKLGIGSSITDLDRIIELERTISEYDKSIGGLELRESDIRNRENEIDIREEKLNTRSVEITNRERDLVRRKKELEEDSRNQLIELISEIEKSRKLVESIKNNT